MREKIDNLMWMFPVFFLIFQIVPQIVLFLIIAFLFCFAIFEKTLRPVLIFFALCGSGYLIWIILSPIISGLTDNFYFAIILDRLGLIGYIILFTTWSKINKPKTRFFRWGNFCKTIHFPLIWKGITEPVWRFILIFSGICFLPIIVVITTDMPSMNVIFYGLLFSFLNATLEEIIWRGFILERLVDLAGKRQGIIISALAFGIYHISLGFSFWVCLAFSIGGFYMSGVTVKSKGLLPAFIMHTLVNMIFVFFGIIF